jgi:predicted dehydrogenase
MSVMRVAVVGAGILGRRHARVFHELEGATLVGVASRSRDRADPLAAEFDVPAWNDAQRMLDEVECDAVAVATPDHVHAAPVLHALRGGRHVLVEKPLATTLPDALAMVDEAARRGLVLQVNYSQRRVAEFAWMKEQLDAGAIGRPVMVQSSKQDTIFVPTRMIDWAAQTSPVFFMSSHDLDLVAWFLGARAMAVTAREQRGVLEARGVAAHDGVDALVAYDTGATASFHSSWIHPETWPQLVTERMTVIGEAGVIHFENQGRRVDCFTTVGGRTVAFTGPQTATEVDGRLRGAFTDSLGEFRDCVRGRREPSTSAARTLHVTETQVAILESAVSGRAVDVPHATPATPG